MPHGSPQGGEGTCCYLCEYHEGALRRGLAQHHHPRSVAPDSTQDLWNLVGLKQGGIEFSRRVDAMICEHFFAAKRRPAPSAGHDHPWCGSLRAISVVHTLAPFSGSVRLLGSPLPTLPPLTPSRAALSLLPPVPGSGGPTTGTGCSPPSRSPSVGNVDMVRLLGFSEPSSWEGPLKVQRWGFRF